MHYLFKKYILIIFLFRKIFYILLEHPSLHQYFFLVIFIAILYGLNSFNCTEFNLQVKDTAFGSRCSFCILDECKRIQNKCMPEGLYLQSSTHVKIKSYQINSFQILFTCLGNYFRCLLKRFVCYNLTSEQICQHKQFVIIIFVYFFIFELKNVNVFFLDDHNDFKRKFPASIFILLRQLYHCFLSYPLRCQTVE